MVIVVMGVSGAGKSTVASRLARRLGWPWRDADDLHTGPNVEKMRRGQPLNDADRRPWLEALRDEIETWVTNGENGILACSALRRAYREQLDIEPDVFFVYLKVSSVQLRDRLKSRRGHFAAVDLLESQLEALEEPSADEPAVIVDGQQAPDAIVRDIARVLSLGG